MFTILAETTTMSVPVAWVLASGAALAAAISGLAKLVYNSQQKQIDALRDEMKDWDVTLNDGLENDESW